MRLEYFQMIDGIEALNTDEASILARAHVPEHSPVFEGHFPGYPLMPGVLLIETMAQASGYLILALNAYQSMPFLASVKEAKLRSFVPPDAELAVSAHLDHEGSGYAMTKARIEFEGKKVCDAQLTFRIMPFPSEDLKRHLLDRVEKIGLEKTN